jgi:hypothetical protein
MTATLVTLLVAVPILALSARLAGRAMPAPRCPSTPAPSWSPSRRDRRRITRRRAGIRRTLDPWLSRTAHRRRRGRVLVPDRPSQDEPGGAAEGGAASRPSGVVREGVHDELAVVRPRDLTGATHRFPRRPPRPARVRQRLPHLQRVGAVARAGPSPLWRVVRVLALGQDVPGNRTPVAMHDLTFPCSTIRRSRWPSPTKSIPCRPWSSRRRTGRARVLSASTGSSGAALRGPGDGSRRDVPDRLERITRVHARPGSKSVEPGIYERLLAEAEGSPLRPGVSRSPLRTTSSSSCLTRLQRRVAGHPTYAGASSADARRHPTRRPEVIATVPPNMAPCTIEKVAINVKPPAASPSTCRWSSPRSKPPAPRVQRAWCHGHDHGRGASHHRQRPYPKPHRHERGPSSASNRANATVGRRCLVLATSAVPGRAARSADRARR